MQFKVPQNVQREDTIIGNITIKQIIILIVGGGLDYVIYIGFTKRGFGAPFWFPPILIIGLLTVAIAFLKINNIPFHKYVMLMIEKFAIPNKRMWKKGEAEVYQGIFATKAAIQKKEEKKKSEEAEEDKKTLDRISHISQILDTHGKKETTIQHPEIDESHDDELLHSAYGTGIKKNVMDKKKEDIMKLSMTPEGKPEKKEKPQKIEEKPVGKENENTPPVKTAPEITKKKEPQKTEEKPVEEKSENAPPVKTVPETTEKKESRKTEEKPIGKKSENTPPVKTILETTKKEQIKKPAPTQPEQKKEPKPEKEIPSAQEPEKKETSAGEINLSDKTGTINL